jgi:aspartokinase
VRVTLGSDGDDIVDLLEKHFIRAEILKNREDGKVEILFDKKKTAIAMHILKHCDFVRSVRYSIVRRQFSLISVVGSFISAETCKMLVNTLFSEKVEVFKHSMTARKVNLVISSDRLFESIAVLHRYCELER